MSSFQGRLDRAAESTACEILKDGGKALINAAAWSMVFGPVAKVPLAVGTVALFASNYACEWDPEGESTLPGGTTNIVPGSCVETVGCDLLLTSAQGEQWNGSRVKKLHYIVDDGTYPNGTPRVRYAYTNCDDEVITNYSSKTQMPISTEVADGGQCVGDPAPAPDPVYPEYEYEEPPGPGGEPGCSLTVNVLGWGANPDGTGAPIYKISPKQDKRAGGGIIGGCNFEPVVYYQPKPGPPGGDDGGDDGGDGDPPYTIPFVDGGDDEDPDWLKLLKTAMATAAGNLVAGAIKELLEQPVAGVNYEMPAPCNVDDEGNPLIWTGEIPEQKADLAILDRLDAISAQLTQHLQWKTPICPPAEPELEGEWRKISFRSDEVSPYGTNRLRKYLRYRSVSGLGLGELVDHWKAFTWTSGATRVRHSGASWGTVEVWASSLDEGKRVIQHAAREAGVDTAQAGRWSSRVSSSSRLGVSLLMRVDTKGGYYWITEREGSDGRPLVAY